ncbi:uncharacterized protein SCHCODRAFT_02707704 [Schizophyllum commune H4-8]|nr:uncharacterized protein SCHCODRAFT_02707704 [Schizophyllum commune H4-8]KAI5899102.1 hypothetical protein SCHCODRAFT_02707704 [Schizophyllum commune H4-8]
MTANGNASIHRPLNADDLHVLKFIAADTAVDLALYGNALHRGDLYPRTSARTITALYAGGSTWAALVLHDHDHGPNHILSDPVSLLRKIRRGDTSAAAAPKHPDECDRHDQLRLERRSARLASLVLMARQPPCKGSPDIMPLRKHSTAGIYEAPLVPLRSERKRDGTSAAPRIRGRAIDFALTIVTLDEPFSDIHVFGSIAFHIAGIYPTCVLFVAIRRPTESLVSAQVSQAMRFEGPAERPREAGAVSDSTPGSSADVLDIGHQDSHADGLSGPRLFDNEGA